MSSQPLCFLNGVTHPPQNIHNRAQAYGDGVFETIRVICGHAPLLPLHLARLKRGLECLGIGHQTATWQYITDFMQLLARSTLGPEASAQAVSGKVKIVAYREAGGHGYAPIPNASAHVLLYFEPLSLSGWMQTPKQLVDASMPLSSNPQLAKIKHLNRLDYILAAHRTPIQQDQALLLYNAQHAVVESLHHNIFIVHGKTVTTPELIDAGVEGVFKRFLIESVFTDIALHIQEKTVTEDDVLNADAVFLTNALTGVTPISHYKNRCFTHDDFYIRLLKKIQQHI